MRNGIALISAVFLMLLVSILMLRMLSYSTDTSARTTREYLYEQATLLAYNATEYAMLQISLTNPATGCLGTFATQHYPSTGATMFDIDINVQYVWLNGVALGANCHNTAITGSTITVDTPEQNGSALIDVVVTSNAALGLDEPIRFHRLTLQKL